jgi:MFS family permease
MAQPAPVPVVLRLGTAQTLAWASSYYLPALLAVPMAATLGLSTAAVFAGFSLALVVSALCGPAAGRLIDRFGGRPVLMGTNGLFALGLMALAACQGAWSMALAWVLIGLAMGAGLYDSAFATLVRLYGPQSRGAITGITLLAGFASTVGWPLTAWMLAQADWRAACLGWALLHLLLGLPLNAWLPRATSAPPTRLLARPAVAPTAAAPQPAGAPLLALALVFAIAWFVSTAMAAHLPRLLQEQGLGMAAALGVAALVGPAQVAARALEFVWLQRQHPLRAAQWATAAHPLGALMLMAWGSPWAVVFVLLHGAGNGILTIAKGTLPLALFGTQGYGARQGWLMAPSRLAQAAAPFVFGVFWERFGVSAAFALSSALGLLALGALLWLQRWLGRTTAA